MLDVEWVLAQVVEGASGLGCDAFLSGRPLYVVLHLIRGYWSYADERVLEVGADLTSSLSVSPLILTTESTVDVTFATHRAFFVVLFGGSKWRLTSFTAFSSVGADEAGITVGVASAELSLSKSVHEHTCTNISIDVYADLAGAAVFI